MTSSFLSQSAVDEVFRTCSTPSQNDKARIF